MNEAPSTPEHVIRTPGALQAVLQHTDGTMDSVAVPLPLPEAIVRADNAARSRERWFLRERSSDSVLRYVEEEPPRELARARHCAQCGHERSEYFVQKPPAGSSEGAVLCLDCYTRVSS